MSFCEFWNECKIIGYSFGYSDHTLEYLKCNFYDHYDNMLTPEEACGFEL